jgi:transcriptional regulator with XRE-family HTH domain
MTDETFGQALRRLRQAAGLSQPALARKVYVSQSFISKVENGAEPPSPEFAASCDEALSAAGALIALAPVRREHRIGIDDVEAWELADVLTGGSLSLQTLERMRRAVFGYAGEYPQATPDQLLTPVHRQLRRLRQALSHPQPLAVRRQAVQLTGILAGIAGNLALDLHREDQAESYFEVAEIAGHEAEDGDLIAWALATRSLVPFFDNRPHDAVALLDQAAKVARGTSSARRQAWIAALQARASAVHAQADVALTHLDAARITLAVAGPPEGNDFFDEARLTGFAGATMLQLRRTDEALDLLTEAVATRPAGDAKGRALATLDLASCQLFIGEAEEAVRLVEQALFLAGGGLVAPIVSRAQSVQADMMAVDQTSAARVAQLLREVASRADRQE